MKHFVLASAIVVLALGLVVTPTRGSRGGAYDVRRGAGTWLSSRGESSPARLRFRWDIVSYDFSASPVTVSAGGNATAIGSDESKITFTGRGTFGGSPGNVTGGGTWQVAGADGTAIASGTYKVTSLVSFIVAPGSFGDPTGRLELTDEVGNGTDAYAGLAVLRIAYSDGSQGTLLLGSFQVGTPPPRLMGITATKSAVAYWERQAPRPRTDGNRTLFHLIP
jgi:hypothetical protein